MFNAKNSKIQGNIGIGKAISYFTSLHQIVSIPLNDSQDYDLIVDDGKELKRVQVKTTGHKNPSGSYEALLKTSGGNSSWNGVAKFFNTNKVEILFIMCDNSDCYCIPTSIIKNTSTITVDKKYKEYKILGDISHACL